VTGAPEEDVGEWIEWARAGECPVDPNVMVEIMAVLAEDGEPRKLFKRRAWVSAWDNPRVIAYRVVRP
jgi:hypothetical protein